MFEYSTYDLSTGAIKSVVTGDYTALPPDTDTLGFVAGYLDAAIQYVDVVTGAVRDRPQMLLQQNALEITADSSSEWRVTGIPAGAVVTWPDGYVSEITGGEIRMVVDEPGAYTCRFELFPYQTMELSIEAINPA